MDWMFLLALIHVSHQYMISKISEPTLELLNKTHGYIVLEESFEITSCQNLVEVEILNTNDASEKSNVLGKLEFVKGTKLSGSKIGKNGISPTSRISKIDFT